MNFDPHYFPYPSKRQVTYARRGLVAASQPLAAQIGLDVMKKGGNAFDAIAASAAAMTALEPCSNGIGGDAFAILWSAKEKKLIGLNSSGPAPALLSEENIRSRFFNAMPQFGSEPVTVPGIPAAWAAISSTYGKLSLAKTLEGAAKLAEEGFPVAPVTARNWAGSRKLYERERLAHRNGKIFDGWFETFAPGGKTPAPGDLVPLRAHAQTLREIGRTNAESFYRGDIAQDIDRYMKKTNGFLRGEDLAQFYPEWVEPIGVNYRGYDIWEIPPNGQGMVALMALNILENFDFPFGKDHPDTLHRQIEALKLAFADGHAYIGDQKKLEVNVAGLLSKEYAKKRSALITENALEPLPGSPDKSGTVYLCTADEEGNMVSYIQSNYMGFGSGLVLSERGIAFQNRGFGFNLDRNSVKYVMPGKRPFHTIIPGFITRNGEPVGPFGIMGGAMQPQAHLQVVSNLIDFNLNPQAALDAPRWQWVQGRELHFETGIPHHTAAALARRGHDIRYEHSEAEFGRGQIIRRMPNGVYAAGTEMRTDGYIAVW
ncbi:gamma-glutamyltransferase [Spirochaetia bacterium]|nr:gamma-glutamyltransferase [Spirochaetia bacterium]